MVAECPTRAAPKAHGGGGSDERHARAALAQTCATYALTPAEVFSMPVYQLDILLSEAPRVEARRVRQGIQAATAPHLKASDRRTLLRQLDRLARVPEPAATPVVEPTAHDPAAAAAWFAQRGVKVV
jgi:hypothetical protein